MNEAEKGRIKALLPKVKTEKAKDAEFVKAFTDGKDKLTKAQIVALVDGFVKPK